MKTINKIIFLILFLIPTLVQAQAIPLNGLSLRLVPQDSEDHKMGPKTVNIVQTQYSLRVMWYSLTKEEDSEAYYPTYKIRANRGIVETDGLDLKASFFNPALWGNGYVRVDTALPLWIDPAYLELKGSQKRSFNIGILNMNKNLIKQAPDEVFDQISFFQNLYDQYVKNNDVREDINLRKSQQKDLKKFVKEFFLVENMAKTKAELYVNGKKEAYPAVIFGNEYFNLVVIDDPLNPLVVTLKIFPKEVPSLFEEIFNRFKSRFEYRITQISY